MACGRRRPEQRRAGRDFPDIARRCDDLSGLDSTVDNFVDKTRRQVASGFKRVDTRPAAQKNGTEKSLKINHLRRAAAVSKVTTVRNASIGAAVERSPRASGCFVDG
jgi:hypothetical protein